MELGQVTESVSVEAEALAINTQNASVGNPFTETQIKESPVADAQRRRAPQRPARRFVRRPGARRQARSEQRHAGRRGRERQPGQLNGFNAVLPIPLDSVQEFRTTVAGQGADQGRSAGGQVSLVTKGGSNQFHGSLYEYNAQHLHRRQQLVQQSRRRAAHRRWSATSTAHPSADA